MEISTERSRDTDVVVLTLNAPERRNAITTAMAQEMCEVVSKLEEDSSVRALVITGAPPAFCAGADRAALSSSSEATLRTIYTAFLRVAESSLPTVAALNGDAVGAGVNLALACDVIIGCPESRIDTRFLKLGIHPGGGNTWWLTQRLGPQGAAALVLFGEVLVGDQCKESGLAWDVVDSEFLIERCVTLAAQAAKVNAELFQRTKRTLRGAAHATHAETLEVELINQLWSLEDAGARNHERTV